MVQIPLEAIRQNGMSQVSQYGNYMSQVSEYV